MAITQVDAAGSILRGMEGRNYLAQMREAEQQRSKRNQLGGLMAQYYGGHDPNTGVTWNTGRQGPSAMGREEVAGRAMVLDPEFGLQLSKHFEGMDAADIEESKREAPVILSVLGRVQDQSGWEQARAILHQQGVDVSDMPSAFDPGMRDGYIATARGLIDWKPTNVAPGNALVDPYTRKEIYKGQAAPPAGFRWTEAGGLKPIPGYIEGQGALAAAKREPFSTPRNVRMPDGSTVTLYQGTPEFDEAIAAGGILRSPSLNEGSGEQGLTTAQQRHNATVDQARATLRQMNVTPEDARRMGEKYSDTGRNNPDFNQYISQLVRQATTPKNGPDPEHEAFYRRYIGGQDVPLPGAGAPGGAGGQGDPMLGEIGSMDIDELDELLNSGALTVDQVKAADDRLNQILGGGGGGR